MKKRFISVAMFLALAVSSPLWVGCSDYDDDIANLQSQVDGLKQSVDVSTAEALQALRDAQAALEEDIAELTSGKADAPAVQQLQETVAALQTAISSGDLSQVADLAGQVSGLIEQVNEIDGTLGETQNQLQSQKSELEGKIESLRQELAEAEEELKQAIAGKEDAGAIDGLQTTVNDLSDDLREATDSVVSVSNRLVEVEKWLENNGEELAKLTANVTKINNLVNTISEEAATTISDAAILAELKTLPATVESLETLQSQIGNATAVGSILYRLAEIETWKDDIVGELLGGTGYDSFASICQKIDALEQTLNGSGTEEDPEANPGIQAQMDEIRAEMAKFDMIQSVVYLPNLSSTEEGGYLLKSSVLKVYNENAQGNDKYVEVAQGIETNEIRFRVSPASKAADFGGESPKYELSFDGEKLTRSFNAVEIVGEPSVDEATGIITYKVKTNIGETNGVNDVWAVCAVIKAVTPEEGEAVDNTNLTTTYFTATKVTDKVKTIKVVSDNADVTSMPYMSSTGEMSTLNYGENLKVEGYAEGDTEKSIVEDMVAEYGLPTISYDLSTLTDQDDTNDSWFKIDENGVLSIPNASNAMIDREVTVTPVANFSSTFKIVADPFATVKVSRREVVYPVEGTKAITWNRNNQYIALSGDEMDEIINITELSRGDYNNLVVDGAPTDIVFSLATGKDIKELDANANVADDNTLYIVVPAKVNINKGGTLKITLRESTASTKTDSYTIMVDYSAMQYPVTTIEKNPQRWTESGTLEFRPQIQWAEGTENAGDGRVVESMDKEFNMEDLFANYAGLVADATEKGYDVVIEPSIDNVVIADGGTVAGVKRVGNKLVYDPASYTGKNVACKIYLNYNGHKVDESTLNISVRALSGTWTSPTETVKAVDDLNKTYNIAEGAKWTDVNGFTMWENGTMVGIGYDDEKKEWRSNFKVDPFTNAVYGMKAPKFTVVDANGTPIDDKYVEVDENGVVSFTDDARQAEFAQAYTVTIRVIATSPWGTITNMKHDDKTVGATEYYQDLTFTINQGAK